MNKHRFFLKSESGQSIVIIAGVLIGLLAMAGLAIDGGNLFLQRRNTQNAADAAAMAGTRVLAEAVCGEASVTDASILATVQEYSSMNGVADLGAVTALYTDADENVLGAVGAGNIPVGATGVEVDIANSFDTYFITAIGIDRLDVSADALAMTGPPISAGGVRPIGVPLEIVLALDPGEPFTLSFGNCPQNPEQCIVSYTGGQVQHRGWLNLAYVWNDGRSINEDPNWPRAIDPSGNANVLKDWMEHGFNGHLLYSYDYIHAKPGRNSSVIGEAPVGETILVPIFDSVPHYDDIPAPKPPEAHQGGGYYYHIVGFVSFLVTGANQGGGTINGEFVTAYIGDGQVSNWAGSGYGQGGACALHTQSVNMWR